MIDKCGKDKIIELIKNKENEFFIDRLRSYSLDDYFAGGLVKIEKYSTDNCFIIFFQPKIFVGFSILINLKDYPCLAGLEPMSFFISSSSKKIDTREKIIRLRESMNSLKDELGIYPSFSYEKRLYIHSKKNLTFLNVKLRFLKEKQRVMSKGIKKVTKDIKSLSSVISYTRIQIKKVLIVIDSLEKKDERYKTIVNTYSFQNLFCINLLNSAVFYKETNGTYSLARIKNETFDSFIVETDKVHPYQIMKKEVENERVALYALNIFKEELTLLKDNYLTHESSNFINFEF